MYSILRMNIDTSMATCGLDVLYHLMKCSIPKLGANVDITGKVTLLHVRDGQTLGQSMTSCSQVESTIRDSGLSIGVNSLMLCILNELKMCDAIMPYIFEGIRSFHGHGSQFPDCDF